MARITVEDCLEKMNNRFDLVLAAAQRARQLLNGEVKSQLDWGKDKATVVALREIAEGLIEIDPLTQQLRSVACEKKEEPVFPVSDEPALGMLESVSATVESTTAMPTTTLPQASTVGMIPPIVMKPEEKVELGPVERSALSAHLIPPVMASVSVPKSSDEASPFEGEEGTPQ